MILHLHLILLNLSSTWKGGRHMNLFEPVEDRDTALIFSGLALPNWWHIHL
ncbi:hypothetical protein KC19_9G091000 [Ceratodon purpureus]|uniref:Uncharacterized protein n=1 Tax=Ceratodon purpureus TaxID=3225 RepID=A0A8T0GTR3_CERPU|nr:hypothetical protein KC19_9G091000 [Ceratodon purpureus]